MAAVLTIGLLFPCRARGEAFSVRGEGGFEARATRDEGDLVLQGALRDDVGEPIGKQTVTVQLTRDGAPDDQATRDAFLTAKSCGLGALSFAGGNAHIESDAGGRFCLRVSLAKERYHADLSWKGASFLEPAKLSLPFDLGRRPLYVAFEPTPRTVSLDRTPARFSVLAESQENGATQAAGSLTLTLATGKDGAVPLATLVTDARGRGTADVDAAKLGPPGAHELALRFAGDQDTGPASVVIPIEVRAKVHLSAPALDGASARNPEDGITIDVAVDSVAGPVPEGTVEARVGDLVVGAAKVENGRAALVATFAESGKRQLEVRLRYLPQSPYYEPGPELVSVLPVSGPSPLTRVPLAIAGALVVGWLVLGRRKSTRPRPRTEARDDRKPALHASVEVVETRASQKDATYTGIVEDAHEGHGVPRVRVWVARGSFVGEEIRVSVVTDDDGRFAFTLEGTLPTDTLSAEGPFHTKLTTKVPSPGELRITLVTRKRKLLERLVAWAKQRGAPYDARPEPTPGHVKRAAREDDVATWARAVEEAAFAGREVDERAEIEIEALFPGRDAHGEPRRAAEPKQEVPKGPKLG